MQKTATDNSNLYFDFISKRRWWYAISLLLIIPGLIFIILGGLKPSIDFTGGTMMELAFEKPPKPMAVRAVLQSVDTSLFGDAQITTMKDAQGTDLISIRTKPIDNTQQVQVFESIKKKLGSFVQNRVEVVGPTIGKELKKDAILASIIVISLIIIYITIRFSLDFAAFVIIALIHDVLVVAGFFAFLGYFWNIQVDTLFVTAVLTLAGWSVNDTIVTFDRIRENIGNMARGKTFSQIGNDSVNETLIRNINTSLTTLLPIFCLFILGGETLHLFSLALLIGIVVGSYSSIFIATPLLVSWRER